ncbi:Cortactin-binding protein 2 [Fasciola gigantica]|uniref:Cortactin-binding protein 2 n=2 Tax=Fasciola TaxID=6191 RepID=A0A2H1CBD2_FASHE|nr:Cortactin-binding protein 2 [Fasciola hepatica]TPP65229.1 Cortactin-binding protein 2 [Fasciola gigantica]
MAHSEVDTQIKSLKPYSYMEEALCKAAASGNLGLTARILHERVDQNCKDEVGRSPLHYAALNGHFEIIRLLLSNKATVDVADANHVTPLHLAARKDHLRCAQLLCLAGADILKTCSSGCTPRDLAPYDSPTCYFLERCELGDKPKVKHLFQRSSKVTITAGMLPRVSTVLTNDAKSSKLKDVKNKKKGK